MGLVIGAADGRDAGDLSRRSSPSCGPSIRSFGVDGVWLAPFFWVATEWLRATSRFAFPWVLLGTSQARVLPLVQSASVIGVYGLSGMVALVGAGGRGRHAAAAAACICWAPPLVALFLLAVTLAGGMRVARGPSSRRGSPFASGSCRATWPGR